MRLRLLALVSAFEGLSANALDAAIHVQGGASPFATDLPPYTREMRVGAVRRALAEANRFGITTCCG